MTTTWMDELPEFAKHFRQYGFDQMMRDPRKHSEVLIYDFYTTYNCDLMQHYPQDMLYNGGDPVSSLMI